MKKLVTLMGVALALCGLSSCLESDTVISVKKDGSGTVTETVAIGGQALAMMQMGVEGADADPFAQYSEESLKEKASSFGEGTEFVSVKKEEKDGKVIFTSLYKFPDINNFVFSAGSVLGAEEEVEDSEKTKFNLKDGVLTVSVPDPSGEDFDLGADDAEAEQQMAMMAPMLAGMRMTAKLVLEDGIKESDATYRDGNTVTLFGLNFDELMKNEGGLKAMKKLNVETREEVAKAITEVKGFEMETKEKVTLTFE